MADWRSIERAAAVWVPCDYQMAADWRSIEPAADEWVPGLPVEYQTSAVASLAQQQLVAYAAAQDQFDEVDPIIRREVKVKVHDNLIRAFEKAAQLHDSAVEKIGVKIHRYPRSLKPYIISRNGVPSTVSIGPYHHGLPDHQEAEKVKHVAAYRCIKESGHSVQEMYDAVVSEAYCARNLYDEEGVAELRDDDFYPMMFYDACFLVQFMLACAGSDEEMDSSLQCFFSANDEAILNDIMMLENQLPWQVVEAVMRFRPVPLDKVVTAFKGCLQDRKDYRSMQSAVLDDGYNPPHFLGLMRFYIVGKRKEDSMVTELPPTDAISYSVNAVDLAEMGITLKSSKSAELIYMGIEKGGHDLTLPQVTLDDTNVCILLNMAAFELCTVPDFHNADDEFSAVCSYLQLLAMIVDKPEDVQQLRTVGILQGGGGLTSKQVVEIFNCLQDMQLGARYLRTMEEIEAYQKKQQPRVMLCKFVSRHKTAATKVFATVAGLAGILGTIISFKK